MNNLDELIDETVVDNCRFPIDLKRAIFSGKKVVVRNGLNHFDRDSIEQFCKEMIQTLVENESSDNLPINNVCVVMELLSIDKICEIWFNMTDAFLKRKADRNHIAVAKVLHNVFSRRIVDFCYSNYKSKNEQCQFTMICEDISTTLAGEKLTNNMCF